MQVASERGMTMGRTLDKQWQDEAAVTVYNSLLVDLKEAGYEYTSKENGWYSVVSVQHENREMVHVRVDRAGEWDYNWTNYKSAWLDLRDEGYNSTKRRLKLKWDGEKWTYGKKKMLAKVKELWDIQMAKEERKQAYADDLATITERVKADFAGYNVTILSMNKAQIQMGETGVGIHISREGYGISKIEFGRNAEHSVKQIKFLLGSISGLEAEDEKRQEAPHENTST